MLKNEISEVNKNFINFFHEKIKDILYIIKNKTESELFIKNYNTKMLLLARFINTNYVESYSNNMDNGIKDIKKFDEELYLNRIDITKITNIFYMYILNKVFNKIYNVEEAIHIVKRHLIVRNQNNNSTKFNILTNSKYKENLENKNKQLINTINTINQNIRDMYTLKTTFNSKAIPRKLNRKNTGIHLNLLGNCFMYADISLINNIKNNILNDETWENIDIEYNYDLMIILYFIHALYTENSSFISMLYELRNSEIEFIPKNYIEVIKKLICGYDIEKNEIISKLRVRLQDKINNFIIRLEKYDIPGNVCIMNIDNTILNNFIDKISFLKTYKYYEIYDFYEKNINIINIDQLFYEVLEKKQFISIRFFATSDDFKRYIQQKRIKNNKKREIIKVFKKRKLLNNINISQVMGHGVVITDIMKDKNGNPKLLNKRYIYRFKNNWGDTWYDKGYGYLTLDSFFIDSFSFFMDDKYTDTINKI